MKQIRMIPDKELLARYCASRSDDAFDLIVERHGPMVMRVCLRRLRSRHDAEDASQIAFLRLARQPDEAVANLGGWLHKVARETALNLIRSHRRRARHEREGTRPMVASREPDFDELREEIDAALVRLPGPLREAVVLHYLEGRDYDEAAQIAGCSESAFRSRSLRGLQRLKEVLTGRGVVCGMATLTAFLGTEALAAASAPPEAMWAMSQAYAVANGARRAAQPVLWGKIKAITVATLVGGGLTVGAVRHEAQREAARSARPAETSVTDFANGFGSTRGLTANGFGAAPALVGGALRLTDGRFNEARSVFLTTPVEVAAFATTFRFRSRSPKPRSGDGLTFCIQGAGPDALGEPGEMLGMEGIPRAVAVKFDFWSNDGEGPNSTGLLISRDGNLEVETIDLTGSGIDLHTDRTYRVGLSYDGSVLDLTVSDVLDPSKALRRAFPLDIPGVVGGPIARVGFTASTGGSSSTIDVLSWSFAPGAGPRGRVPAPVPRGDVGLVFDHEDGLASVRSRTANWAVDRSDPSRFRGHASRLVRTTPARGNLVYEAPGLAGFLVTVWYRRSDPRGPGDSGVAFEASPDGAAWTAVAAKMVRYARGSEGWASKDFASAVRPPAGSRFLKVTFTEGCGSASGIELGDVRIARANPEAVVTDPARSH